MTGAWERSPDGFHSDQSLGRKESTCTCQGYLSPFLGRVFRSR